MLLYKTPLNSFWLKETNGCHVTHELGFITSDILVNVEEAIFSWDSILNVMPSSREEEERESDYYTENRWTVAAILSLKV
jgi:hypothetical protein